jgi:hypothetical protein
VVALTAARERVANSAANRSANSSVRRFPVWDSDLRPAGERPTHNERVAETRTARSVRCAVALGRRLCGGFVAFGTPVMPKAASGWLLTGMQKGL